MSEKKRTQVIIDVDESVKSSNTERNVINVDSSPECSPEPKRRRIGCEGLEHHLTAANQDISKVDPMRLLVVIDPLTSIPEEIACIILRYCFTRNIYFSLIRLSLVSKGWKELLERDFLWQWLYQSRFYCNKLQIGHCGWTWKKAYKWKLSGLEGFHNVVHETYEYRPFVQKIHPICQMLTPITKDEFSMTEIFCLVHQNKLPSFISLNSKFGEDIFNPLDVRLNWPFSSGQKESVIPGGVVFSTYLMDLKILLLSTSTQVVAWKLCNPPKTFPLSSGLRFSVLFHAEFDVASGSFLSDRDKFVVVYETKLLIFLLESGIVHKLPFSPQIKVPRNVRLKGDIISFYCPLERNSCSIILYDLSSTSKISDKETVYGNTRYKKYRTPLLTETSSQNRDINVSEVISLYSIKDYCVLLTGYFLVFIFCFLGIQMSIWADENI
eukprot:TRINITY_DN11577_c0_g1_i1.p1 TRINITY_DN11577_c0_g1~~TRINITY_DN11577_c0_g1_i1.p1  ORF type:complete len:457 (-),score=81.30 TRINITY_DN11577_c0_g1_i1:851-2167(-)